MGQQFNTTASDPGVDAGADDVAFDGHVAGTAWVARTDLEVGFGTAAASVGDPTGLASHCFWLHEQCGYQYP